MTLQVWVMLVVAMCIAWNVTGEEGRSETLIKYVISV